MKFKKNKSIIGCSQRKYYKTHAAPVTSGFLIFLANELKH